MIRAIQRQIEEGSHRFTLHAFERCVERGISPREVEEVILHGEVIEDYPKDKYGPSCLIYGVTKLRKILHVSCVDHYGL